MPPLSHCLTIEDLRRRARRRLPRVIFDYIDGGAEAEVTLRANVSAFESTTLRPRSAVFTPSVDLRTTVLGTELQLPFLLAPIGSSRLFYPKAEIVAAAAAGQAGTGYILSTLSGSKLEDVRAATRGPAWFQLYLVGGREVATAGILRAKQAGFGALVVTIDTPVAGLRLRDLRNGMKPLADRAVPAALPFLPQFATKLSWLAGFLSDGGLMNFPNVLLPGKGPMPYADVGAALAQSVVTWEDFRWIRDVWQGPIVVKGVHTAGDARRAVEVGASAVIVSNHGGRQLDGVAASVRVLPEVVNAVGNQIEVLMDGGIRRGSDIVKAMCLGAKAVLVGRAYAYGMAAAGGPGVTAAIDILRADLVRTLTLLGCSSASCLDRSLVAEP